MTVMLIEKTPAVLSLGKLCEDHGFSYHWTGGQKPHLTKNGKTINCKKANYVPFVVPGLSTSSSTSSSLAWSTSSSQDTVINTENPATERSEIMSEESRGNPSCGSAETENTNKNEDDEELRSELLQDVLEWLQDFKENLVDKSAQPHQYFPSSSHELLMEPRSKVVPCSGKRSVCTHFPKDRNCDICLRTKKIQGLLAEDVLVQSCPVNHEIIIDTLSWYKIWQLSGYNPTRRKTNTSQETQKSLQKFLEPTRKPKVICTDNSLEFGKYCEEFSWNHCTSTPHRSETNGIAERAVHRVKKETSAVLLQSGLDEKWWADSMECYCYLRKNQDLLSDRKTPYERRFGMPFDGPVIPFGAMVEHHPISAKDLKRLHQTGPEVLSGIFLGCVLYAMRIWKGDIMVTDIEELEPMDASELHGKRLNAKEVLAHMDGEKFIFPVADGTVKLSGGDEDLRTSTLIRDSPDRGEEQDNLRGESEGSSSTSRQDSSWYDGEAKNVFGSITGECIHRHHVEPRVKRYMPREESIPMPHIYVDVTRNSHTS